MSLPQPLPMALPVGASLPLVRLGGLTTTFQVGAYNGLTDAFTLVLDLNDFNTFWIEVHAMKFPQPKKVYVRSSNIRYPGEVIQRYQYQNRHIQVSVRLRNTATPAILNSIRRLLSAIENPPYTLRIALPGADAYSYADVLAVSHNIPADPQALLAQVIPSIQIDFECKPGLRGDRVVLDNLVFNPGFEAPSGTGVTVFNDPFANNSAYTILAGPVPAVAANVMTLANGCRVVFGSPAWGAINTWQIRFQFVAGATPDFYFHYTDANNYLDCFLSSTAITLRQLANNTAYSLATGTIALTSLNWYWLQLTQYPNDIGSLVEVQAALFNDAAGAIGSAVAGGAINAGTHDGFSAVAGRPQIAVSGNSLPIGGAFSNVHTVALFAPGGWNFVGTNGTPTGTASGAVDGLIAQAPTSTNANTFPGGPVLSAGCARIDLPPAGTVNAFWGSYIGGNPIGSVAMIVVTAGDTIPASAWVRTQGLSATASINLQLLQFNNVGTLVTTTVLATLTGNQPAWVQISGQTVTVPTAAFAGLVINVVEPNAGASANGTVWIDNTQAWDMNSTGGFVMPYCETRFTQSPAQLLLSGIAGDMLEPCIVQVGAFVTNFATSQTGTVFLGRRNITTSTMRLVQPGLASGSCTLDPTSYGGYNAQANLGGTVFSNQAESGAFHMLGRAKTANGAPGGVFIAPQVFTLQNPVTGLGNTPAAPFLSAWQGGNVTPFTATNTWTTVDCGQIILPISPFGILQDPNAQSEYLNSTSGGSGGSQLTISYGALLPIDGDLFVGSIYNPSVGTAITNRWLYLYWDGTTPGSTSYSTELGPGANATHSVANPGAQSNNFSPLIVTAVGDSLAQLDPTLSPTAQVPSNGGVNQFLLHATDNNATEFMVAATFVYTPLYLYPR